MQIDVANGVKGFSYMSYIYIGGIVIFALIGMFVQFKMKQKPKPPNSSTIVLIASGEDGNEAVLEEKGVEEYEDQSLDKSGIQKQTY